LQVPAQQLPGDLAAQVGRYRSLLAGRRMLVLLDNASSAEQVRPLLPGDSGCLVIVTSRNQLSGLVVSEGAWQLALDRLPDDEAGLLLAARVGQHRLAVEPGPVQDIIGRCGGLPLALAVVAARAAAHPGFPLAALAAELARVPDGLDAFDSADPVTGVRAVFSWSYRALDPAAASLFRQLGLHPGPDLTAVAAASLAGVPAAEAARLLTGLANAHLINEHAPGRYALHDLLRTYAAELARSVDPPAARSAARHRLLDHYLHVAHAATRLMVPGRGPLALAPARSGVARPDPPDGRQASAWFASEHRVLLAAIAHATDHGFDTHAWQLAWATEDFLDGQGRWHDLAAAEHLVLRAVTRLGDPAGQAHTHRGLARAYLRLGRVDEARIQLGHALDRFRELGDRVGEAHTTRNLALVLESQGCHREALEHARRALTLYPRRTHQLARARVLSSIGWCHAKVGEYRQAIRYCQEALRQQQEIGDRRGQASTWHSLGYAHHQLGCHQPAIACLQHAVRLHREFDNRHFEATALSDLGDAHQAASHHGDDPGGRAAAREAWERALAILRQLGHPDAEQVGARLRRRTAAREPEPASP
jgi:tetratricopeptide (TPR) repeat protein